MTGLDKVKEVLSGAARAVVGVRDAVADIDRKIEVARQRREELLALPVHPDDHVARVHAAVDQRVAHFERRFAGLAASAAMRPSDLKGDVWARTMEERFLLAPALGDKAATMRDLEAGLCFVFRDAIKEVLETKIRSLDHTGHGPTAAQRMKEIEKLDKELLGLRANRLEIMDALAAMRREGEVEL